MQIIDGNKISEEIRDDLRKREAPEKFFAAMMVGEDSASLKFVERKKKFAESIGVEFKLFKADVLVTTDELSVAVRYLADDPECGGLMIQLPVPFGIDKAEIFELIPRDKDVDALNKGAKVLSPSVLTVEEILKRESVDISNSVFAVVGLGFLVGEPVAAWLRPKCKKLILIDKDDDINGVREAGVVILGAGRRGLINAYMLKEGAIVIDFGCSFDDEGKVCGDFDTEGADKKDIKYTLTPGGTGPILVAKLFENFYRLNGK